MFLKCGVVYVTAHRIIFKFKPPLRAGVAPAAYGCRLRLWVSKKQLPTKIERRPVKKTPRSDLLERFQNLDVPLSNL